jgi:hypothetical protein
MTKDIRHIVMIVHDDASFVNVVNQVAQLALNHHATLHLLYIGDLGQYQSFFSWAAPKISPLVLAKQKLELLTAWKNQI